VSLCAEEALSTVESRYCVLLGALYDPNGTR
jgi:hypothetical protein